MIRVALSVPLLAAGLGLSAAAAACGPTPLGYYATLAAVACLTASGDLLCRASDSADGSAACWMQFACAAVPGGALAVYAIDGPELPIATRAAVWLPLGAALWTVWRMALLPPLRRHLYRPGTLRDFRHSPLGTTGERSPTRESLPAARPTLVSQGSLRIDRDRALEKLARFQTADPGLFVREWLRCAVASGATRIELDRTFFGLELRFDGKPLDREQLQDPYGCLFDSPGPGADGRARSFASGLLSALQLGPTDLVVSSGRGADRCALRIGASAGTGAPDPAPGTQTVVRVSWRRLVGPDVGEFIERAGASFGLSTARLVVDGTAARARGRKTFSDDRGRIRGAFDAPRPEPGPSHVSLYKHGVLVGTTEWEFAGVVADAELRCDAFTLDASRAAVVRDRKFHEALEALAGAVAGASRRAARASQGRSDGPAGNAWLRRWRDDGAWRRLILWNLVIGALWCWLSGFGALEALEGESVVLTGAGEQTIILTLVGTALSACALLWMLGRWKLLSADHDVPAPVSAGVAPLLIAGCLALHYHREARITVGPEEIMFSFPWPKAVRIPRGSVTAIRLTRDQRKDSDSGKLSSNYILDVDTKHPYPSFSRSAHSPRDVVAAAKLLSTAEGKPIEWGFDPASGGRRASTEPEATAGD